ncbi:hypothetical protein VDG1235_1298 [Verrucomicrobiia bacterium DG1235]|nr:hypothetical protein VDG1235_1298 [Verrucomicrobiae bacterium DG1235]
MKKLLLILFGLILTTLSAGRIIYVSDNAADGGDGSSWEDAFNYLQDALDQTLSGGSDEIWITSGIYYPDDGVSVSSGDRLATFALKSGIAIYGGFAGDELSIEERVPQENPTILSGEIFPGVENSLFWSLHVIKAGDQSTLDNLIIEKGNANGSGELGKGGGIYTVSEIVLVDCTLRNNSANGYGGGVFGNVKASTSSFTNNTANDGQGGAIYGDTTADNCTFTENSGSQGAVIFGNANVTNCIFEGNLAVVRGSAISAFKLTVNAENCIFKNNTGGRAVSNGDPTLIDCVFEGNVGGAVEGNVNAEGCEFINNSSAGGGALSIKNSGKIENCKFYGNTATTVTGGAISGAFANFTVSQSEFRNNSASTDGGAISGAFGEISINACIFDSNTANENGGAVDAREGIAKIRNSVFFRNSGKQGGAINDSAELINCTIQSNVSSQVDSGGAVKLQTESSYTVLFNCVVSGNLSNGILNHFAGLGEVRDYAAIPEPDFPDPNAPEIIRYPNLIGGGVVNLTSNSVDLGETLIVSPPEYLNLENPEGLDGTWGTTDDGLRPIENGNLEDAADRNAFGEFLGYDVVGFYRDQGSNVDLGAYEFDHPFALNITIFPEDSGNVSESGNGLYDKKAVSTINAEPFLGYVFDHWEGDVTGFQEILNLTMESDINIIAVFAQDLSDTDLDGLSLYEETVLYSTDPNKDDTDTDGFDDKFEIDNGLDPLVNDTPLLELIQNNPSLIELFSRIDLDNTVAIAKQDAADAREQEIIANPQSVELYSQSDLDGAKEIAKAAGRVEEKIAIKLNPKSVGLFDQSDINQTIEDTKAAVVLDPSSIGLYSDQEITYLNFAKIRVRIEQSGTFIDLDILKSEELINWTVIGTISIKIDPQGSQQFFTFDLVE